jgi:hypothetical protein
MKLRASKLLGILVFLSITWANYCYADLIVTGTAFPPKDQKQGYIENSPVTFTVINGQAETITKLGVKAPVNRTMRRVLLNINGKKILIQNSADNELYVKGQDQSGSIVNLENQDYAAIQQALKNLGKLHKGNNANELHEAVGLALSLLASWPQAMPLLIWQDDKQNISALDANSVILEDKKIKSSAKKTRINKVVLQHPDEHLKLPEILPLQPMALPQAAPTPEASAAAVTAQALGASSSDSSISLCSKMGTTMTASYPLISTSFLPPFVKVVGTEKYSAIVGGVQCLARCGGGCVDSVVGVSGFGKNAYSQDCLDHDMCVTKRGNASYCNFIFSDAANDFFSAPCGHDLVLENVVVSNTTIATSQLPTQSSKFNLFVIFTVKNNANTKLPHNKVFFDISVDGKKRTTTQLANVINAFGSRRYYYQIGIAKNYIPGKHTVGIQIKSPALIQLKTSNDVASRAFNLL